MVVQPELSRQDKYFNPRKVEDVSPCKNPSALDNDTNDSEQLLHVGVGNLLHFVATLGMTSVTLAERFRTRETYQ